jgi:antitoxin ParD1/3/4
MPKNTSISLGDHFNAFIEQQVSCGRYGSASEVVRAGLRELEDNETRLTALRSALADGEASGASTALDVDAFLKAKRQKVAGQSASN